MTLNNWRSVRQDAPKIPVVVIVVVNIMTSVSHKSSLVTDMSSHKRCLNQVHDL
jgi:hypothetical protein